MEMAAYLGRKDVPVALVVPFDGTQSFAASDNVARVLNLTQRDYAYMRRGRGFKGTLANVDVSSDPSIDHINIDKSPRLHARVVAEVLAVVGNHRVAAPGCPKPSSSGHHLTPNKYRIDTRRIDALSAIFWSSPQTPRRCSAFAKASISGMNLSECQHFIEPPPLISRLLFLR